MAEAMTDERPRATLYTIAYGGGRMVVFHCPGCSYDHGMYIERAQHPCWTWNGDLVRPTLNPSLLVVGTGDLPQCHSFIRDGQIQFLGDCGHALMGQTVDLPPWADD